MRDEVSPSPAVDDDFRELLDKGRARARTIAATPGHRHQTEARRILDELNTIESADVDCELVAMAIRVGAALGRIGFVDRIHSADRFRNAVDESKKTLRRKAEQNNAPLDRVILDTVKKKPSASNGEIAKAAFHSKGDRSVESFIRQIQRRRKALT